LGDRNPGGRGGGTGGEAGGGTGGATAGGISGTFAGGGGGTASAEDGGTCKGGAVEALGRGDGTGGAPSCEYDGADADMVTRNTGSITTKGRIQPR